MRALSLSMFLPLLLTAQISVAATNTSSADFETTCRVKAKEVAAETYRSCVTDNRNAQIEKIKSDYQEKIKNLKADYEQQIQKLSGKNTAKSGVKQINSGSSLKSKKVEKQEDAPVNQKDESTMDIPEPVPVENSAGSANI